MNSHLQVIGHEKFNEKLLEGLKKSEKLGFLPETFERSPWSYVKTGDEKTQEVREAKIFNF